MLERQQQQAAQQLAEAQRRLADAEGRLQQPGGAAAEHTARLEAELQQLRCAAPAG